MKIKQAIREYKTRKAIKYLQKEIIWRCLSYEELERMKIEDIFTHERKYKMLDGEVAIVIKNPYK